MKARLFSVFLAALLLIPTGAHPARGQEGPFEFGSADALRRHHPGLFRLIDRLEHVQAAVFKELARRQEEGPSKAVAPEGELDPAVEEFVGMLHSPEIVLQMDEPFGELGTRAAEVIRWGHAFQREVLSVLADPDVEDPPTALADAVTRYRARTTAALPSAPKNMDVLYDHAYALGARDTYAQLGGLVWAGYWLWLAATEPLADIPPSPERAAGIDTVVARYQAKLSFGEPPHSFPTELPLAPAIAPGLIWLSPESAMIWDNLSMMLEVLADVLATAEPADAPRAIEAAVEFFLDPEADMTDQDEWEIMALRHGIFHQGGFPIAVMTRSERNESGHAAHLQGGRVLRSIPGMRR